MPAKTTKQSFFKPVKMSKAELSAVAQTERDFKDAILMVSIFANLFVLCIWVALQTTSAYDNELASFFISR